MATEKEELSEEDVLKSFEDLCKKDNGRIIVAKDTSGNKIIMCKVEDSDEFSNTLNLLSQMEKKKWL